MILNSQIQIDDMSNEFLSIMIVEFSNWLRFDQSQKLNLCYEACQNEIESSQ